MQSSSRLSRVKGRRRTHCLSLIAFFVLTCAAAPAFAQGTLLDQASALLRKQDANGAYALLADAESAWAGDPAFDYMFGIAALDSGHVTRAIFALERLVQGDPGNKLAHAELGRAYLAAGDPDAARAEMRHARSDDLPEGAAGAIARTMGVIDQVSPPTGAQVSDYLEIGGGYDSNVNSATNQGEFAIPAFGGILFQTSAESRQQHDWVGTVAGGATVELPLAPAWKLFAVANVRGTVDRVVHDMNTVFLDATVGVRRTAGSQSQVIALQNGSAWVGGSPYRSANGLTGQWQWQLSETAQSSVFGQWSHQDYMGQPERNTDRSLLGLGFGRDLPAMGLLAYGSVYVAREKVDSPQFANFGHHAVGLRLGAEQKLAPAFVMFFEWQHERRRYGGTEPFFDTTRSDHQNDVSAGLRYSAGGPWQVVAQLHHTRAGSDVVLYDYSRSIFQITLHRNFQ